MSADSQKPSLPFALSTAVRFLLNEVHTAMPGTIEQYDYTKCKANIQPSLQIKYNDGTIQTLPILVNVPIVWPRTSEGSISFPLKRGDGCLVLFSERSLDEWLSLGKLCTPNDPRRFDLSDGMAIPGLFAFDKESAITDNDDFQIVYKDTNIRIKSNGDIEMGAINATLQSIVTGAYKIALETYFAALQMFMVSTSTATTPAQIAAAAGVFLASYPTGFIAPDNSLTVKVMAQ
jgi:hypothetical protein